MIPPFSNTVLQQTSEPNIVDEVDEDEVHQYANPNKDCDEQAVIGREATFLLGRRSQFGKPAPFDYKIFR